MQWKSIILSVICAACSPLSGVQYDMTQKDMIEFVDSVKYLFDTRYAPNEWKQGYCRWDCSGEAEKLKSELKQSQNLTVKEFQRKLCKFFNSTKDYHVGVCYYSTEMAYLPFCVKGVDGHYYVTIVDDERLGEAYDIQIGDELVTFDGKPAKDVVARLKETSTPCSSELTDQSLAEDKLTNRFGALGDVVPSRPVNVTFKSHKTGALNSYQLAWEHRPERIPDKQVKAMAHNAFPKLFDSERIKQERALPLAVTIKGLKLNQPRDPNGYGERESFLPKLGEVIWSTSDADPFDAYLYIDGCQRVIGYLRIPHYMFEEKDVEKLEEVIELFAEKAEALVLDQMNNPGGDLFLVYALASMLTDKPLVTPKEHILISQNDIMDSFMRLDFLEEVYTNEDARALIGESFHGNPVNYQLVLFIRQYCRFLQDQWLQGKYYTDLTHMYGIDQVNPHPKTRFTKPILLLINELDFSCGDFFPAIMKDNQRATLLGVRTAGAGGFVVAHYVPNRLGVKGMRLTGSLGIRPNGNPIENLGVEPDIVNRLTVEDIQGNYQNYVNKIHDTLNEMIQ